jgi:hypothetical protein
VTGKNISWSNAGQPDIFDPNNIIAGPQDDVMTAIYVFNGKPYVFGQHTVGTIEGTTDGTFFLQSAFYDRRLRGQPFYPDALYRVRSYPSLACRNAEQGYLLHERVYRPISLGFHRRFDV